MFGKRLFHLLLAMSIALISLFSGAPVGAVSARVTQGDVEAVLQSWNTGRLALLLTSNSAAAAQLDGNERGRLFFGSDGRHYCVQDWHVVLTSWVTGGDKSFTYQDAVADLASTSTSYFLDGVILPTQQTPLVRRVGSTLDEVDYGYAVGSLLAPADLGVGGHTLTIIFFFDGSSSQSTVSFYMDAAGTGACVQ
jgi:hypothetical protein